MIKINDPVHVKNKARKNHQNSIKTTQNLWPKNPYPWLAVVGPRADTKFLQQLCDKVPSEQMQRDLPIFFREARGFGERLCGKKSSQIIEHHQKPIKNQIHQPHPTKVQNAVSQYCEVSYRQFMDVLVPLLSSAELQPQVLAMLNSLGSSAAMLIVLNSSPKGKLAIVLKAPVEVGRPKNW